MSVSLIRAAIRAVRLVDRKRAAIMAANLKATRPINNMRSIQAKAQKRDSRGRFARTKVGS